MKKYIAVVLFLIVFGNFAIAQEVEREVEPVTAISFSFFNIILSSGIMGILVWAVILTMLPFATILGITSIICSVKSDGSKFPFTFKWLLLSPLFYFFVGAIGVIIGVLSIGQALAEPGSAAGGAMIAVGISSSLNTAIFTLLGMLPFFFFILICMLILHFKRIPSPIEEEVSHV